MIFEDKSGIRWKSLRWKLIGLLAAILFLFVIFAASLLIDPELPPPEGLPSNEALNTTDALYVSNLSLLRKTMPSAEPFFQKGKFTRTAFVLQDSQTSVNDLLRHLDDLDAVFPNWFNWTNLSKGLQKNIDPELLHILSSSPIKVLPMITNVDEKGVWHGKDVGKLLADTHSSEGLIQLLAAEFVKLNAAGINVDFEMLKPPDRNLFSEWIRKLSEEFHHHNMLVTVDVPVSDPAYDYAAIGSYADAVVAMAYDEHYATGYPGPIAGADWYENEIKKMMQKIPPQRLLGGIGVYSYDWDATAETPARAISFAEAIHLADSMDAGVDLDTVSLNEYFQFNEQDGDEHQIWMLDALTVWNNLNSLKNSGVGGFALWRLGLEDHGIWEFIKESEISALDAFDPMQLSAVKNSDTMIVEGDGEIFRVLKHQEDGERELTINGRKIVYSTYTKFPKFGVVEKHGYSENLKVALTFDDGPDPRWTPQILQILKENDVPGTFFLVGLRAARYPELVSQEFNQGHLLGNHTFLHPNLEMISKERLQMELNATQHSLESAIGRRTALFRCPFNVDTTPISKKLFLKMHEICNKGYYIVGAGVDSHDWKQSDPDVMVDTILEGLKTTDSNIVVFHDFGMDRQGTVDALKMLIPNLKEKGYQFVTVEQLLEIPRDVLMPEIPKSEWLFFLISQSQIWVIRNVWPVVFGLFLFIAGVAIFRVLVLGLLICSSLWKQRNKKKRDFTPPATVLVPAYNEAKVIEKTISAALSGDYPQLKVIVIDDGSTDNTAEIVEKMAQSDPRLRLIRKPNGGKSSALNLGMSEATDEYIVTIDADTIILKDTIRHLIAPFSDENVDAVCGNVQVGNINCLLSRFQDVEYVTTQNYDRRAFDIINCIMVVPGATGAWKRDKVLKVGGYSSQTITEDADLSMTLLRHGGRIVYAPLAKSNTEVPDQLGAFYKQRFRWSFGILQCLWKHRMCFGHGIMGWVGMPNILVQVVLQIAGPICDIFTITYLLFGEFENFALVFLVYLGLDLFYSLVAFALDGRNVINLFLLPILRIFYRPILYVIGIKAILATLRGRRHLWNKIERKGVVPSPQSA